MCIIAASIEKSYHAAALVISKLLFKRLALMGRLEEYV